MKRPPLNARTALVLATAAVGWTTLAAPRPDRPTPPPGPDHWAFVPPQRPDVPRLPAAAVDRVRNPIDAFVLRRLRARAADLSPDADRATLLRRVTLALTGLPPAPDEVAAFASDPGDDAYGRVVDRLLASQHHAERLASWWLDQARFADTDGYHIDGHRDVWKWRDWVIAAFANNKPFDTFTIEQLAGDLLPQPTIDQFVATGFNRNHMTNIEGGADPEEYATRYVIDRVNTTATVWLGLTMKCAECHDHKYDPITQRDYYSFYAFFNNIPERGLDGYYGNAAPFIPVADNDQQAELNRLNGAILGLGNKLDGLRPKLEAGQRRWEKTLATSNLDTTVPDGMVLHQRLDGLVRGAVPVAAGAAPAAVVKGAGSAAWPPGRMGKALRLDGIGTHLDCGDVADFGRADAFTLAAWVHVKAGGTVLSRMREEGGLRGYDLSIADGRPRFVLAASASDALEVRARDAIDPGRWRHVLVTHDGSGTAAGIRLYVDGMRWALETVRAEVGGDTRVDQPLRIGRREITQGYQGAIDDLRCYERAVSDDEARRIGQQPVLNAAATPAAARSDAQRTELRAFFARHVSPLSRDMYHERDRLEAKARGIVEALPQAMIMAELPTPKPTHVLLGGNYQRKGEAVTAGVPAALGPLPDGKADRMALARWLVDSANPLTARVVVNRLWGWLFGAGIVTTTEDLGTRGARPTHPELLDWLAVEFVESGWDVRHLVRLMVTSTTFRQASAASAAERSADPTNRWLSRMPRLRLDAEAVRDNALAIAGLLDRRVGGPSVRPFQPPGLWKEVAFGGGYPSQEYEQSQGADNYRRGLYVYWKRSAPYASFRVFDAPTREICTVSRPRTNTPLQALALLNDPVFLEAARAFAARMLDAADRDDARLDFGLRTAVARAPRPGEIDALGELLAAERRRFAGDTGAAQDLLAVGDYRAPVHLADTELAAWTMVGSAILNLSEAITRP